MSKSTLTSVLRRQKIALKITLQNIEGVSKQFQRDARAIVFEKGAQIILSKIKQQTPVRKSNYVNSRYLKKKKVATYTAGNLRRSMQTFATKGGSVIVGPKVGGRGQFSSGGKADGYYSHMVERGTKHFRARKFFFAAFRASRNFAFQIMVKSFKEIMSDYLKKLRA